MSLLGWRQWAVDRRGMLRPAWTPWSPYPAGLLLWRPDGLTEAHCLRNIARSGSHNWLDGEYQPASAGDANAGEVGRHRERRPGSGTPPPGGLPHAGGAAPDGDSALDPARRGPGPHPAVPDEGCVCGLYAWDSPETLAAAPRPKWTSLPVVAGVARLGGRMIIAERGFRAQHAFPVAVLDPEQVVSPAYAVARYRTWDGLVAEWDGAARQS